MPIWGNRDREPAAEETPAAAAHESDSPTEAAPGSDPQPDVTHESEPSGRGSRPWRRLGKAAARTPNSCVPRCASTAGSAPRYGS
jgi:hypothetical protein